MLFPHLGQAASEGELQECDEAFLEEGSLAPDYESLTDTNMTAIDEHTPTNEENDVDDETTSADNDVLEHRYQERQQRQNAAAASYKEDTTFDEYPDYSSNDSVLETGEYASVGRGREYAGAGVPRHSILHQEFPESLRLEGRPDNLRSLQRDDDDTPQADRPCHPPRDVPSHYAESAAAELQFPFATASTSQYSNTLSSGDNLWKIVAFRPDSGNSKCRNKDLYSMASSPISFNSFTLDNASPGLSKSCSPVGLVGTSASGLVATPLSGAGRNNRKVSTLDNKTCRNSRVLDERSHNAEAAKSSRTPARSIPNDASTTIRQAITTSSGGVCNSRVSSSITCNNNITPKSTASNTNNTGTNDISSGGYMDTRPTSNRLLSSASSFFCTATTGNFQGDLTSKAKNSNQLKCSKSSSSLEMASKGTRDGIDKRLPKGMSSTDFEIVSELSSCLRRLAYFVQFLLTFQLKYCLSSINK